MLALSEDGDYWRTKTDSIQHEISDLGLHMQWLPWPDVAIETWLIPAFPWHVRIHRIKTSRRLIAAEGGFAASCNDEVLRAGGKSEAGVGFAHCIAPPLASGIRDLAQKRVGEIIEALPNTNLLFPKSRIPTLKSELEPGEHWLHTAVLGTATIAEFENHWPQPPRVSRESDGLAVFDSVTNSRLFFLKEQ